MLTSAMAIIVIVGALTACGPAAAHHSPAQFDTRTEIVLEGTVTRYDWKNPHIYMAIEMRGPDGVAYEQEIEAGASSVLLPLGLTPDSVAIGDVVSIVANPNRGGPGRAVLGRMLTKADGTELPLNIASRSVRRPSDAAAEGIAGTWFAPREGLFALTGSRGSWNLTEQGRAALGSLDAADSAHASCIPVTAPTLMVYPVTTVVEVNEDTVVFNVDWMTSKRIVYLDGRDHPADGERTLHGHSIGHWEGETLVVDTRLFADHREGLTFGVPSGAGKHLIERFALSEDRRHLNYDVTMEDPEYLVGSVTLGGRWDYRPDLEPTGLACDLDVARRFLTNE